MTSRISSLATKMMIVASAFLAGSPAIAKTPAEVTTWQNAAVSDLKEMRDLIRDNTPGPVDPQNPHYLDWLERGYKQADELARAARTKADYNRALKYYGNGFRDGHIQVGATGPNDFVWPGFLTVLDDDGTIRVRATDTTSSVSDGSRLLSCDGVPAYALLANNVDRFRTNADIPQSRQQQSFRLFYTLADDSRRFKRCVFLNVGGQRNSVKIVWKPITSDGLTPYIDKLPISVTPAMSVRKVDNLWFISIPSFDENAEVMNSLIDAISARRSELLAAPIVVIDVRGNGGGNSEWGHKAAAVLWGENTVDAVERSFDWTTDWRASRLNIDLTRANAL